MTTEELSRVMNVSVRTVRRWIKDGCPVKKVDDGTLSPKNQFDLAKVKSWRESKLKEKGVG